MSGYFTKEFEINEGGPPPETLHVRVLNVKLLRHYCFLQSISQLVLEFSYFNVSLIIDQMEPIISVRQNTSLNNRQPESYKQMRINLLFTFFTLTFCK